MSRPILNWVQFNGILLGTCILFGCGARNVSSPNETSKTDIQTVGKIETRADDKKGSDDGITTAESKVAPDDSELSSSREPLPMSVYDFGRKWLPRGVLKTEHEPSALSSQNNAWGPFVYDFHTRWIPNRSSETARKGIVSGSASEKNDSTVSKSLPAVVSKTCTYSTYEWHVGKRKAVGHRRVKKLRADLTDEESDPKDRRCTVCEQDQHTLKLDGLPAVTVCRYYAEQVTKALLTIRDSDEFKIERLKGYRPGRTRGRVRNQLRTQFSNHSFGTAIDINPHRNGLYTKCRLKKVPEKHRDLKTCKLSLFGHWRPKALPKVTVVSGDIVHRSFTPFWEWGGARKDAIKDFMHFSITGY